MAWERFTMLQYLPDIPDALKPADSWSVLTDANWRDGAAYRDLGEGTAYATGTAVNRMEWVWPYATVGGTNLRVLYAGRNSAGTATKLGIYAGAGTHTDKTTADWIAATSASTNTNMFTGGFLGGGVLVNIYGIAHAPVWFSQSAATATDLSATLRFAALRPYKYFAIGIADKNTPSPGTVRWSDAVAPGVAPTTWAPAAGNSAGDFDLSGAFGGELVDGGQLGEDFVVYGQQSMHLMSYVGGATVMTERRLSAVTGLMGRNCWADTGSGHVALTPDDVVLVTPGLITSLCDAKARKLILSSIYASTVPDASQVWYERKRNRVWVAYCVDSTYLTNAFILDLTTGQWGRKTFSRASSGALQVESGASTEPNMYLSFSSSTLASNNLYAVDSDGGSGSGVTTAWYKYDLDMGDSARRKFLRGIRVLGGDASSATGTAATVKVRVGSKNSPEAAYTFDAQTSYALGTAEQRGCLGDGRWLAVEIESSATTDKAYHVTGFELDWDWAAGW